MRSILPWVVMVVLFIIVEGLLGGRTDLCDIVSLGIICVLAHVFMGGDR